MSEATRDFYKLVREEHILLGEGQSLTQEFIRVASQLTEAGIHVYIATERPSAFAHESAQLATAEALTLFIAKAEKTAHHTAADPFLRSVLFIDGARMLLRENGLSAAAIAAAAHGLLIVYKP